MRGIAGFQTLKPHTLAVLSERPKAKYLTTRNLYGRVETRIPPAKNYTGSELRLSWRTQFKVSISQDRFYLRMEEEWIAPADSHSAICWSP